MVECNRILSLYRLNYSPDEDEEVIYVYFDYDSTNKQLVIVERFKSYIFDNVSDSVLFVNETYKHFNLDTIKNEYLDVIRDYDIVQIYCRHSNNCKTNYTKNLYKPPQKPTTQEEFKASILKEKERSDTKAMLKAQSRARRIAAKLI
jgi:hypothetical protein